MARRELEIYVVCPRCQVTHPPGTARCLYCGDPTLRPGEVSAIEGKTPAATAPAELGGGEGEDERPEAASRALLLRGLGETIVLLLLALALALYRTCRSGG